LHTYTYSCQRPQTLLRNCFVLAASNSTGSIGLSSCCLKMSRESVSSLAGSISRARGRTMGHDALASSRVIFCSDRYDECERRRSQELEVGREKRRAHQEARRGAHAYLERGGHATRHVQPWPPACRRQQCRASGGGGGVASMAVSQSRGGPALRCVDSVDRRRPPEVLPGLFEQTVPDGTALWWASG
jgi:hypothetical protein